MGAARIGRVRLKHGGAELRIIDRKTDDPGGENWRGKIVTAAKTIASYDEEGSRLTGFLVIGFFEDGGHSVGWRWDCNNSPIPARLMPAYVAEIVREEMVSGPQAHEMIEDAQS